MLNPQQKACLSQVIRFYSLAKRFRVAKRESRCDFRVTEGELPRKELFLEKKAQFAGGTLGPEVVGEVEGGSGAGRDSRIGTKSTEREKAGGFVEAEAGTELAGCGAEDAAPESGVEGAETVEFDGDCGLAGSGADGAATATD